MQQLPDPYYRGSVKTLHRLSDGTIATRFSNRWSAFDVGPSPQEIEDKGAALCKCAVESFETVRAAGVRTHYIEQLDEMTFRHHEVRILEPPIVIGTADYAVPAEWIFRDCNAGSLDRAFRDGTKRPTDYGFPSDDPPRVGAVLPNRVHMFTTKREATDREITAEEARAICGLTSEDEAVFWMMIDSAVNSIKAKLLKAGFTVLDGKLEVGFDQKRNPVLIDVFGTPDEDRPVLTEALNLGAIEHYNKELLREELIRIGYYDQVKAARKAGKSDPPYPHLSEEFLDEVSRRYKYLASMYCAA